MYFSNDTAISQLNENEYDMKMEERKRKRRSKINPCEALVTMRESGDGEEGDILLHEGSQIAHLCELMVGERSSGGLIRALQEQKREEVAVLLEMMMTGGMRPVKVTEWAEKADIDEYYIGMYAREVRTTLPPGIVKMKDGNFVMGDTLTKYIDLDKAIYAHEMMVILDEKEKMSEKEITSNLGISSLEGFLSMKTIKDIFYVKKINGELVVSMRV